jgi:hypothetical protein
VSRAHRSTPASMLLVLPFLLAGCREAPAGPAEREATLYVVGDDVIHVAQGDVLSEELRVAAIDPATRVPLRGLRVEWRLLEGQATLTETAGETDSDGVATTALQNPAPGTYRLAARTARLIGDEPRIEVRVVAPPTITAVQPALIAAGGNVVITGINFSGDAAVSAVYFDGIRGRIVSATPTELRATAPTCLPQRNVQVRVGLGGVMSNGVPASTTGGEGTELSLQPGQVRTFAGAELECIRFPAGGAGAIYLMVVHNTAPVHAPPTPFELRALSPFAPVVSEPVARAPAGGYAEDWELRLRSVERHLAGPEDAAAFRAAAAAAFKAPLPVVGQRREFNVLDREGRFRKVTATVRAVTARAIIYVDVDAETQLSADDVGYYGGIFDDAIYGATVDVFGEPSDVDANERIVILFTPRVNELTPRNEASFVAGFFYGCDLVGRNRCSGSNSAEIFYSIVPDPTGRWGDARTAAVVRSAVPPVMAHEFQHMINYAQRGLSSDVLWLAEALAHTAEEIVAEALVARGATAAAVPFRQANLLRAQRYLGSTSFTPMLSDEPPGTIELRGGGWLFLKHLRSQYGGNDLLRRLTSATRTGVANVVQETGQPWVTLVTDFGVALWADGAPQMRAPLEPRYQFTGFDLRTALAPLPGAFTLAPPVLNWRDVTVLRSLPTGGHDYYGLIPPTDGSGQTLNFVLAGTRGAPLAADADIRLSILRVN